MVAAQNQLNDIYAIYYGFCDKVPLCSQMSVICLHTPLFKRIDTR